MNVTMRAAGEEQRGWPARVAPPRMCDVEAMRAETLPMRDDRRRCRPASDRSPQLRLPPRDAARKDDRARPRSTSPPSRCRWAGGRVDRGDRSSHEDLGTQRRHCAATGGELVALTPRTGSRGSSRSATRSPACPRRSRSTRALLSLQKRRRRSRARPEGPARRPRRRLGCGRRRWRRAIGHTPNWGLITVCRRSVLAGRSLRRPSAAAPVLFLVGASGVQPLERDLVAIEEARRSVHRWSQRCRRDRRGGAGARSPAARASHPCDSRRVADAGSWARAPRSRGSSERRCA